LGGIWADVGTLDVERAAAFPQPSDLPIAVRTDVEVAPGLRLLGWDALPQALRPGESIPLTLYWLAEQDGRLPLSLTAQLGDQTLETWTLFEGYDWRAGEILAERQRVVIPRDHAGGDYALTVSPANLALGTIKIDGIVRVFDPPEIDSNLDATFSGIIALYGYTFSISDDWLDLELVWRALQNPPADYTVFIHIVDESGRILLQSDVMPVQNIYPTSLWSEGEYVVDPYRFQLPDGAAALRIGLYVQETGERLRLTGDYDPPDYVVIHI
jgi:hypothetical protein